MKNRKRLQNMMLILGLSAFLLAGCGHEHEWVEATCTEPKTCTSCGETEGEALGHTWVEATCTEPKTCSVCGETEGEALGHTWVDATYEAPKTCSVCGATEGEPLTINLVGTFEGQMNGTYFDVQVNSQEGNVLNIDLYWYNMRMGEDIPTMDITLTDLSSTFSGPVEGGGNANGAEREFTLTFQDENHATLDIGNGDILDLTRVK